MSRQYKREYALTIIPIDEEAIVIRNLRINFEIRKSVISAPNLAKVTLFNLSQKTLSSIQKKFTKVILNVGYGNDLKMLYKGEIRNVFQSRNGVDTLTTFYAGDGERAWQNASLNKTYDKTVSPDIVIKDIIKTFINVDPSLASGSIETISNISDKLLGQTLSGSSKDILNTFADEYGFDWSIDDGKINVINTDSYLKANEAVLITNSTGMINSPILTEIGVDVTTLLNPRLIPNNLFKIESIGADVQMGNLFFRNIKRTKAEGIYKIQETIFKGDNYGGVWLSSVKGRSLNV